MSPSATIKQRSGVVEIESEQPGQPSRKIVVRRMAWSSQRQLFKQLAEVVRFALAARSEPTNPGEMSAVFGAVLLRLPEVIASSDQMLNTLVLGSTELKLEEFEALDSFAALEVIRLSLELNFDDELKNSFAAIVNKVAGMVVAERTKSSASSTPTSSMPATAPTT